LIDEPQDNETHNQDDVAEGQDSQAAGPVAEDDSSSSRDDAPGEESSSTPPAAEAPEAAEESVVAEGDAAEEAQAVSEDESVEEEASEPEPKVEEKKKDVIPGADLEPIAVEPEERPRSAEEQARLEAEEEERAQKEAAALAAADEEEPAATGRAPAKIKGDARYLATGKRKTSIARVTLLPGSGKFTINNRELDEFFPRPLHRTIARQPLTITGYEGNVDVRVRVHGGGISGQAGAVRHGIARALTEVDAELRGELKRRGFLTRDARAKERRKAGLKKARKRPQFSKR